MQSLLLLLRSGFETRVGVLDGSERNCILSEPRDRLFKEERERRAVLTQAPLFNRVSAIPVRAADVFSLTKSSFFFLKMAGTCWTGFTIFTMFGTGKKMVIYIYVQEDTVYVDNSCLRQVETTLEQNWFLVLFGCDYRTKGENERKAVSETNCMKRASRCGFQLFFKNFDFSNSVVCCSFWSRIVE